MPLFVVLRDGAELDDALVGGDPAARARGLLAAPRAERDPGDRGGPADAVGQAARGAGQADPDGRAARAGGQPRLAREPRGARLLRRAERRRRRAARNGGLARQAKPFIRWVSVTLGRALRVLRRRERGGQAARAAPASGQAGGGSSFQPLRMAAADVAGAHVQQRGAARVEPLAPQVRAQRVGPGEQQPGGGSGDGFAHERVVEVERRRDRLVLVAAVADRRDDRVRAPARRRPSARSSARAARCRERGRRRRRRGRRPRPPRRPRRRRPTRDRRGRARAAARRCRAAARRCARRRGGRLPRRPRPAVAVSSGATSTTCVARRGISSRSGPGRPDTSTTTDSAPSAATTSPGIGAPIATSPPIAVSAHPSASASARCGRIQCVSIHAS